MADNTLVASRPLSTDDKSYLRSLFGLHLIIRTSDDEGDAVDLLDYALDMVGRGKNVGSVVEEVSRCFVINMHFMKEIRSCCLNMCPQLGRCFMLRKIISAAAGWIR